MERLFLGSVGAYVGTRTTYLRRGLWLYKEISEKSTLVLEEISKKSLQEIYLSLARNVHLPQLGVAYLSSVYIYTTVWTSKEIYNKPLISVAQPFR